MRRLLLCMMLLCAASLSAVSQNPVAPRANVVAYDDENGLQKTFYYVQSAKSVAEAEKTEPIQANLSFEAPSEEDLSDEPF